MGEFARLAQDALQKSLRFFQGREVIVRQGHLVRQRLFQNPEKSARMQPAPKQGRSRMGADALIGEIHRY